MHMKNQIRKAVKSAIENLETRRMLAANPELVAVVDGTQNFGNTRRSVAFYDVSNIRTGTSVFAQTPLFTIWNGYEVTDVPGTTSGDRNFEEVQAFTVSTDGKTGYLLATDSGTPGTFDPSSGDNLGDYDLYLLDIQGAYNDYIANNRPRGVMYAPRYTSDYRPTAGVNSGIDYVTQYGARPLGPTGLPNVTQADAGIPPLRDNSNASGADDIVFLDGVTQKAGELARRGSGTGPFFNQQDIQYVNPTTLVVMENTTATSATVTGSLGQDYSIRTFERVSTSPGNAVTGPNETGGYNSTNTQSWQAYEWSGDNFVDMDNNAVTGGISDVDGMRYLERDGTKGVWVSDRDGGGDDMSFFSLDFATRTAKKLEHREGVAPFPKAFALDEDPEVSANTNDGDIDGFDLDSNNNLVIRESDFLGSGNAGNLEPKIITRAVSNYNAGDSDVNTINEITFGAWDTKARLVPTLDDDTDPVNGQMAVYDKAQNLLYYFDTDAAGAGVVADAYVYDLTTETLIYQELDAVNNFFGDGNLIRAFTLGGGDTVAPTVTQAYAFQTEQSVTFNFSEALATSGAGAFSASDITLTNTTTSTVIPTADLTLVSLGGNVYKLTYKTGAATTPLPKGVYTVVLNAAGITDAAGNPLTPPTTLSFKVNPGDTDQDGDVDFDDLLTLAQNYGSSGKTYSQGNVNYDAAGNVDFDDLLLLAQNYGTTLIVTPRVTTASAKRKTTTSSVLA